MARIKLDVKFLGTDFDEVLTKYMKELDPQRWQRKKNGLINRGLKMTANDMLPKVWREMPVLSGIMRMFTAVYRITSKGGGWRIATPRREELSLVYPEADTSAYYYPTAIEYGFKKRDGSKQTGDFFMKDVMYFNRDRALSKLKVFYLDWMAKTMKRQNNKVLRKT